MKRQLTSILLFSALLVGGASTFVSCTDHESDSAYDTSVSQIAKLTELNKWLGELKETNPDLASAIDARIKANMDVIKDGVYADKERFEAAIQGSEAYKNLKGDVEGVDSRVSALERLRLTDSIAAKNITDALNHRLDSVSGSLNDVLNILLKPELTGITVNATENPVTGYWNASFIGLNLKLASSFYGVAAEGNEDWGVKANQVLGKGGNAGYLYVTLNQTDVDPSLVKVELVNSQGESAKGFELGDIEKTDKVLTFGYSRAASKNGFYQIPVIASDPQNDDIALDKGSLKEAAQNILAELKDPKGNDFDLTKVAAALYKNNLNNKLQAYTVKASYYLFNPETGKLELKHAVGQYNVAAFAVKPLSFNFGKDNQYLDKLSDWSMENLLVPSLSNKLKNFVDGIKFDVTYEGNKEINVYTILAAPGVHASDIKADGSVDLLDKNNKLIQNIPNVSEVTTKEVETDVNHTTLKTKVIVLKSTDDSISKVLESVNNSIAKQLDPIKDKITNAGEKWDNMASKVNTVLKKVYSKIGSANRLLEPTILYLDNNNNPNTLSTLGGRLGTRFVGLGSTTLYATSWTAELLAPAYLKKVYVVEDGAEVTLADGKTSAKTPFNGTRLIFTAKKPGKYTIVYKAIDYSGVLAEKTFHVEVVK